MKVGTILEKKGGRVVTVGPEERAGEALGRMRAEGIGSLVVEAGPRRPLGLLDERDLLEGLARHGGKVLDLPVRELMRSDVVRCSLESDVREVMRVMTSRRIRHLPVVEGSVLAGVVSIGDVVKHRIEEAELEVNVLRDYALSRSSRAR